jgi:hypothetical protein
VILREATPDDLSPLLRLCRKVWAQLGVPFDTNLDRFSSLEAGGFRIVVLYDSPPASDGPADLAAALMAHPLETDRGPGFEIKAFVVDQALADKTTLLDALSLYAMNIAAAEGRYAVLSRRPRRTHGTVYGRDKLGMDATQGDDAYIHQTGQSKDMMAHILKRHPEWQLP